MPSAHSVVRAMNAPVRVLIVDDSSLARNMLSKILGNDPGIEVVGTATDPYSARGKIKQLKPDVLTLDVQMPKMDGITFLENLMRLHPMPVVMISCMTTNGADITLQALEIGAVDFVTKPKLEDERDMDSYANEVISKVKVAASSNVRSLSRQISNKNNYKISPYNNPDKASHQADVSAAKTTDSIIAIGASTGGTEAIREILTTLKHTSSAIMITQHIPALFSAPFAARLNAASAMTVCEAQDGQLILQGHVYVAPGDRHLRIIRDGAHFRCKLDDSAPVNMHRPSVDVLFQSVAEVIGTRAIGVLLTGMGRDGASGLKLLKNSGAVTIAQDKDTSLIWGMPGAAVKLGAAEYILPLGKISAALTTHSQGMEENRNHTKSPVTTVVQHF